MSNIGTIVQVIGPVVDCEFPADAVPEVVARCQAEIAAFVTI